jgi:hypothetical protein
MVTRIVELGTTFAITSYRPTLRIVYLRSVLRFLVTANVVPSPPILAILMMEAICSSETLILTRATPCNIQMTSFFKVNIENKLLGIRVNPSRGSGLGATGG